MATMKRRALKERSLQIFIKPVRTFREEVMHIEAMTFDQIKNLGKPSLRLRLRV